MKKILFLFALLFVFYSVNTGEAITLECMFCHSLSVGAGGKYPPINTSLFGTHININSSDSTGNLTSNDCISCHYSASTFYYHAFPVSTYTCEDCHINGAAPGAPRVNNHIKNSNISVNAFCSDCHNKTATLFKYNRNASAAHYGRNASFGQSPGYDYCAFCHSNLTTIYKDVMQNQTNAQLKNHSSVINNSAHPAGQPDCSTCHENDRIHGSNISKPILNSYYCLSCHINDTLQKTRHNDKVECLSCHTGVGSDIHNIKYIMQDGSYSSINATACTDCHDFNLSPPYFQVPFSVADCTTCHQNGGLARFYTAPLLPTPLNHSTNPNSGSMWNGVQLAYWNKTSLKSACIYCHGNALHSSNATGNITNIRSGNIVNQSITNTSYWCANCHYMDASFDNYYYNASSYSPVPPEIQNKTGLVPQTGGDGTNFFNHSFSSWSDNVCKPCHSSNSPNFTTQFIHDITSGGGGSDCISCHGIYGNGAPINKRVNISDFNDSVHNNINGGGDRACWACHGDGDGSEGAQPEGGHPLNYQTPKNCNNNECHSISQSSYQEPMVYSHFQNASWNNNPNNNTNYNVTVPERCENCHINSLVGGDGNSDLAKVSHYGSKENLLDSFNCIYCHLNKDNSEDWGNATLINKDRTSLIEFEKEKNKFTLFEGDSIYLGEGYDLKLVEISSKRENALIQILKDNEKVDEVLLARGSPYYYEQEITIENATFKTPVLIVNITSIFKGEKSSFIQFEGSRVRKVHTEKESKNSACYACHLKRFSDEKERYRVIDREKDENPEKDRIYYSKVLIDFNSTNKNKIYFNDEDYVFSQVDTDFGKFFPYSSLEKKLIEGEIWNISNGYSLKINEISTDRKNIWLTLIINNSVVEDTIVGSEFTYEPGIRYKDFSKTNVSIFSTKISSIFLGNPNFILLTDVAAISPDISKTTANTTLFGYNSSWFKLNDTFTVGKIPSDFHAPNLYTDQRNWADCVECHDSSHNLRISSIDAISSSLGKHSRLNDNASNKSVISDPIDKACWACHTNGKEPITHSPTYNLPRNCKSCHIYQEIPSYDAINISDEPHAAEKNCESCHFVNSHILKRFAVSPVIKEAYLSEKTNITQNQSVRLVAEAIAGYKMKIRAVEYFIDEKGLPGTGIPMVLLFGYNDSQIKDAEAYINTSDISIGSHVIYIHAMERNNSWGDYYPLSLNITSSQDVIKTNNESPGLGFEAFLIGLGGAYLMISIRSRRK